MRVELVTKEDLQFLRIQLIEDFKKIVDESKGPQIVIEKGYKTADVRRILGCCTNTLTSLRTSHQLRTKKVGGTVYYNKEDIKKLLEEGF